MAKNAPKIEPAEEEQLSESYISIGLGLLVVIVVGILLYNYFTQKNQNKTDTSSENTTEEATNSAKPGNSYTVVDGDTLWSISEKSYGTGYDWKKIADANNLTETSKLETGQKIVIPETTQTASSSPEAVAATPNPSAVVVQQSPEPAATAQPVVPPTTQPAVGITGNSYTVVPGDTLWAIAQRAYNDPYKWSEIAKANNLVNPNLIYAGNVFTLPR